MSTESSSSTLSGYYRKIPCSLCSSRVLLRGEDTQEENERRTNLLQCLCLQMPLTRHRVPKECTRTSFALCEECIKLVESLEETQLTLDTFFKERDRLLDAIRVKTEEGVKVDSLGLSPLLASPCNNSADSQIRKMILAGRCEVNGPFSKIFDT